MQIWREKVTITKEKGTTDAGENSAALAKQKASQEAEEMIAKLVPEKAYQVVTRPPGKKPEKVYHTVVTRLITVTMGSELTVRMGSVVTARVAMEVLKVLPMACFRFTNIKWNKMDNGLKGAEIMAWGRDTEVKILVGLDYSADRTGNYFRGRSSWQTPKETGIRRFIQDTQTGLASMGHSKVGSANGPLHVTIQIPNGSIEDGPIEQPQPDGPEFPPGFEDGPNEQQQTDGPELPPGFEEICETVNGPPKTLRPQKKVNKPTTEARRSPRIKRKMEGPYIPILERALMVKGYAATQPKKKSNNKAKATDKPSRTYAQTTEPLTEIQAELVIAAAGIEMDEPLQEQVNKEVRRQEAMGEGATDEAAA